MASAKDETVCRWGVYHVTGHYEGQEPTRAKARAWVALYPRGLFHVRRVRIMPE